MKFKSCFLLLVCMLIMTSCTSKENDDNIQNDTTQDNMTISTENEREIVSMLSIIESIDLDNNYITIVDYVTGTKVQTVYNVGVIIKNSFDSDTTIKSINVGDVVDASYYYDNNKLISLTVSSRMKTLSGVTKVSVNAIDNKVTIKGTSYKMWDTSIAFSDDKVIDIREINLEDQVTIKLLDDKIIAIVVELGHGYVRLEDYETFIGGTVEIGYDVIVPVTDDMLLTVREGNYKLRIAKGSYSEYKNVSVTKDEKTTISLAELQIPYGSVSFNLTPSDAVIKINGKTIDELSYYNLYGTYNIYISAKGYKPYKGTLNIDEYYDIKTYTLIEETTEETTEDKTEGTTTSDSKTTTSSTSTSTTEESEKPSNTVTIKTPVGAQVYVDGDYIGESPISFPKTVGTKTITLYKKGCIIKSYNIESKDDGKNDEYSFDELATLSDLIE